MISGIIVVVVTIAAFLGGIFVGANSSVTIHKAIETIKEAEEQAKDTLADITAHKAS